MEILEPKATLADIKYLKGGFSNRVTEMEERSVEKIKGNVKKAERINVQKSTTTRPVWASEPQHARVGVLEGESEEEEITGETRAKKFPASVTGIKARVRGAPQT